MANIDTALQNSNRSPNLGAGSQDVGARSGIRLSLTMQCRTPQVWNRRRSPAYARACMSRPLYQQEIDSKLSVSFGSYNDAFSRMSATIDS